jgi:hypothetical protein
VTRNASNKGHVRHVGAPRCALQDAPLHTAFVQTDTFCVKQSTLKLRVPCESTRHSPHSVCVLKVPARGIQLDPDVHPPPLHSTPQYNVDDTLQNRIGRINAANRMF